MRKLASILFGLLLLTGIAAAQQPSSRQERQGRQDRQERPAAKLRPEESARLAVYQDTLAGLGDQIMKSTFSPERIEAGYRFIKTLVNALQVPGSYHFRFDSVKNMRILYAEDNSFRLMSWYVDRGNASRRFYGAIQMNQQELKLFGLVDHSSEFSHPEDTITSYQTWYGAYYYQLIPVTSGAPGTSAAPGASAASGAADYYVLLGWNSNGPNVSSRVIDVLHFENGEPRFGLPVFDGPEGVRSRVVFRYSSNASMKLDYLPEKEIIIFDHLIPIAEEHRGDYRFYGPDLSYDGFELADGRWKLVENLELENPRTELDKLFNDPERIRDSPASKLPEDN